MPVADVIPYGSLIGGYDQGEQRQKVEKAFKHMQQAASQPDGATHSVLIRAAPLQASSQSPSTPKHAPSQPGSGGWRIGKRGWQMAMFAHPWSGRASFALVSQERKGAQLASVKRLCSPPPA